MYRLAALALALAIAFGIVAVLPSSAAEPEDVAPGCFARIAAYFTGRRVYRPMPKMDRIDAKARVRELPTGRLDPTDADRHSLIQGQLWLAQADDVRVARGMGRVIEGKHVEDLPVRRVYNYVVLTDGTPVFGIVQDKAQYGVRPFQLARGRPVVATGELRIDPQGNYSFTATPAGRGKTAAQQAAAAAIREHAERYWRALFKRDGAWSETPSRVRDREPSPEEIRFLCGDPVFKATHKVACL